MSTYVVGDLQGCYQSFLRLLKHIQFGASDRLWLVGDLVNRGHSSLSVLRWMLDHDHQVTTVLGNHDLHALVVASGYVQAHRSDTLDEILQANDRDDVLGWLRHQRLAYTEGDFLSVHAGLLPQWDTTQVMMLANEVECMLRGNDYDEFLRQMYGNQPDGWDDNLTGWDRLRVITNAMTRIRICNQQGRMEFSFKGEVANIPSGYMPWYAVPNRANIKKTVLFGHWSALGFQQQNNTISLDTGCLWGGPLSAFRLDDARLFQVPCDSADKPSNRRLMT